MSALRALIVIIACAVCLAVLGTGAGFVLGQFVPGYYRQVFSDGKDPQFDPVSVGMGQGLTQGTAGGVVVGLALVVIFCFQDFRLKQPASSSESRDLVVDQQVRTPWLLIVASGGLILILLTSAGFVLGLLNGERAAYHRRYLEERRDLATVLESDPAFARIQIYEYSGGGVHLSGNVSTDAQLVALRNRVELAIGTSRAKQAMDDIRVK